MANPKVHVKKGDKVIVITGKNTGKKGKILTVIPDKMRVVVEGVNIVKRHTRPTPKMTKGGILEKEAPVHASNVSLFCDKCNAAAKFARKLRPDGTKARVCKRCGESID